MLAQNGQFSYCDIIFKNNQIGKSFVSFAKYNYCNQFVNVRNYHEITDTLKNMELRN